ncbi:hypothetical protein HAX54_053236 [Datura stramonium]|uniref:UBC core domain-containing protein n=1 Tax=Datura stramonium TaxID=4076 RepID=A0ABS8T113_DATST|nr:hypothetical protein [Datura stramonium]
MLSSAGFQFPGQSPRDHKGANMDGKTALEHISEAQKQWANEHPTGFVAMPVRTGTHPSSINLMEWNCYIPGKAGASKSLLPSVIFLWMEWSPDLTIEDILVGIQDLLDWPNPADPTQDAYYLYINDQDAYKTRVKQQVKYYASLP